MFLVIIVAFFFKEKTTILSEIDTLKEEIEHQKEETNKTATEKVNICELSSGRINREVKSKVFWTTTPREKCLPNHL